MRKYRRIIPQAGSKLQGYQLNLMALGLSIILIVSMLSYKRIFQSTLLDGVFLFGCISFGLSLFIFPYTLSFRERVSMLPIADMSPSARKLSKKIKRLFNDKQVTDVLKLSNNTRYGTEMPEIHVWVDDTLNEGFIAVENIANYDRADREKFEQRISGILAGKYQRFSIVDSELSAGDSFIIFYFEDTLISKRLVIQNNGEHYEGLTMFKSEQVHDIQLSQDLIWHTEIAPHLSIIARTRAGKSVFAGRYLTRLMLLQGWVVEYHSAKLDRYVKEFNGQSEPLAIIERAEYWCDVMDKRLATINDMGKEKASEIPDMQNIGLFFDELGNLNAALEAMDKADKSLKSSVRWTTAINRLTATGASAGIHIIAISQFATKEGFLPSLARVNCSDAVIMLGGAADSASERQYLMSGFADMPKRRYGQGQGLAKITGSGRKWENAPHFFEAPLFENLIIGQTGDNCLSDD